MSPFFRHIEKPYTQTNSPTNPSLLPNPKGPRPRSKQQFKGKRIDEKIMQI